MLEVSWSGLGTHKARPEKLRSSSPDPDPRGSSLLFESRTSERGPSSSYRQRDCMIQKMEMIERTRSLRNAVRDCGMCSGNERSGWMSSSMSRNEKTWADREETAQALWHGWALSNCASRTRNEGRVSNDVRTNKRRINA
jgi:hypothetical protein